MRSRLSILVVSAVLAFSGCGSDDPADTTGSTAAGQTDTSVDQNGVPSTAPKRDEPVVKVPDARPPKELIVKDIVKGDGEEVEDGDTILVDYVGVYYESGREFENSWIDDVFKERYEMGAGEMIDGWKQGLKGMKVGGRRELIIPPDLSFESYPVLYVIDLRGIE